MGPLALMAKQAGIEVCGSDLNRGAIYDELVDAGVDVEIGEQDGEYLQSQAEGLDWFVHTSALPENHPELIMAKKLGIRVSKRDDLTAFLVEKLGLKMIAVAGTHGKTTTTAMTVWTALKLGLPVAYIVGTTLGFALSGAYHFGDKYFIYEADEYDRNFLKYHPWLAVITCVSYDHPDIYATEAEYRAAFGQFKMQSERVIEAAGEGTLVKGVNVPVFEADDFRLAGAVRRKDAVLAGDAIGVMLQDSGFDADKQRIVDILNQFPGVGRRFEKLAEGIYTDYAHHPEEIAATVEMAREQAKIDGKSGVVVVYQPHQNTRQHEVRDGYVDAFSGVDKIYWLPTYLTRENPALKILSPADLIDGLSNQGVAEAAELNDELYDDIVRWRDAGYLVLLMAAGPADGWLRNIIKNNVKLR